ncbi:MAG TPA: phage/plasmid primase, P4 family [Candidatus Dormibacteraeota bacterium]|nr:phage/plasmid primase, P4 family [Candidatus Dormibacteraeota bacterium]
MKPIDLFLSKIDSLRPIGDEGIQWMGCCPAHGDAVPSLSILAGAGGTVVLSCKAGCSPQAICDALGLKLRDLFPVPEPANPGVTVATLAVEKAIPRNWLRLCGLRPVAGRNAVEIPYRDESGAELFARTRVALKGKGHTRQPDGVKLRPYGLWKLAEFREGNECLDATPLVVGPDPVLREGMKCPAPAPTLTLVEGESDCWRLWLHGFPALGIPGAASVKTLTADCLEGFDAVLIWGEPDSGGDGFVRGMKLRLAELGYTGTVKVHTATKDAKDPADIGAALQGKFPDFFRKLVEDAPVATDDDPVSGGRPPTMPPCVADAGFESAPFPHGQHTYSDYGNARRLVHVAGQDLLHVHVWDRWYVWDGIRWAHDETQAVRRLVAKAVQGIWWEIGNAPSKSAAAQAEAWWKASQSAAKMSCAVSVAETMVPAVWQHFDQHDTLLNAANGTIDLATGELREPNRDDLLTRRSPIRYDPTAECPTWERTLEQIFPIDPADPTARPDVDTIEYIHRLLGCCLTGRSPQFLPVFQGEGNNGKSMIVGVMKQILGDDYTVSPPTDLLMEGKDQHPTMIAQLYGKRAAFVNETEKGRKLRASLTKKLTGGDHLSARRMGEDFWEFRPTHTLILCTNPKPKVDANDAALWRRLVLVPFRCNFWTDTSKKKGPEHLRANEKLLEALTAESEGILAWLVRGAMKYLALGFLESALIVEATREYRDEEDTVGQFLAERVTAAVGSRIEKGRLYQAYCEWSEAGGTRHLIDANGFGKIMSSKGYQGSKSGSIRYWIDTDLDNIDQISKEFD